MAVVSHVPAIAQPVDQIRYRDIGVPEIMSIRGEIVEEPVARVIEDKIYVAVGKQVKESKSVLLWALKKWREKRFCIIHVHQPAQKIPVSGLGSKLPVSSVSEQEVRSYREFEKREMQKSLDEYLLICQSMRVRAEKLFIESDSIEKGLVQLILQYGIKKLVMGAAADKHYKRKMVDLKSRKAISVRLQAPASCQIWFICNGNIILERNGSNVPEGTGGPSTPGSSSAAEESCDEWDDVTPTPVRRTKSSKEPQDFHNPSPPSVKDGSVDDTLYDQLEQAIAEAENSRQEAFVGAVRRGNAEKDAIEAIRRAKASESLYTEELKRRKEVEEALGKENLELERLRKQQDEVNEELQISLDQKSLLESQIAEVDQTVNELEQKIVSAVELLQNYKKEREELQIERDNALKEAEELRRSRKEASSSMHQPQFFSEFSFLEIEKATCNFDPSLKIGEGGYGSIYKGMLRHMHVAIKMLHSHSLQGPSEFQQEVDVLSKIRHPNLVTLIGACPEAWTLVYEYLCNGSLEDRLSCRDNSPPLSWQTRIHIATELCSVLTFLHSCKPHCIVHGDLKPANILLDANFVSKLSDFGICRLLSQDELSNNNTTPCCRTNPKGTFAYMDPEFLATGELTPKSDVYSFGIILLRLLTGRPALGITKEVQYALDTGKLKMLLDPLAGDWPFVQAEQLANLALRCCEMNRKSRPDLGTDVWRVLEPMRASCGGSTSFRLGSERRCQPPPYFICPIFQEVMRDPHVAADGFTYEAEALRGWLDSGHDTSPMTNHALSHKNLVPNLALRSAIQEWLQQN